MVNKILYRTIRTGWFIVLQSPFNLKLFKNYTKNVSEVHKKNYK